MSSELAKDAAMDCATRFPWHQHLVILGVLHTILILTNDFKDLLFEVVRENY